MDFPGWALVSAAAAWALAMCKAHFSVRDYFVALIRYVDGLPPFVKALHKSASIGSRSYPNSVPACPAWARFLVPFWLECCVEFAQRAGNFADAWKSSSPVSSVDDWVAKAEALRDETKRMIRRRSWLFTWRPFDELVERAAGEWGPGPVAAKDSSGGKPDDPYGGINSYGEHDDIAS